MNTVDLIRTAAANTVRSKLRTTLTVLALFVGAFTLTLTTALGAGVSDYVTKQVASLGAGDVFLISKSSTTAGTSSGPQKYDPATSSASSGTANPLTGSAGTLSATDIDTLKVIPGLKSVDPIAPVSIDWISAPSSEKYQLSIAPTSSIAKSDLKAGEQLSPSSSERQLVLPDDYVTALRLGSASSAVGTEVTVGLTDVLGTRHEVSATVVGISNASLFSSGAGANAALVNELSKQQNAGSQAPARYPNAVAHFDKNASAATIDALKKKVAAQGMTAQTIADQLGVVQTIITGITGVLNAFAIVALLAAAFGIVNTLLMSVQERTREIGLMKAMGMSSGRVFALFSLEAAFIGFLGSAIGAGVAILVGLPINAALGSGALAGLAGLNLLLFQPGSIIGVILLIIVVAFLAGTLPARRAARKTPIDALRYE
ncbi:ABC transporter permease [Lacisediminihabitans changchengi]|uniref:ABC transporter permease n=1 Tax=Lacisediminihabitans changchengi TaxID=2787634 RepID=A0A934SMP7_9MICO|nr:ABC transporter permease [Lacisediminihabitans changchengi]MBK4347060.1 ABC transporter permease [Lacisediminihabitans changchengi]MBK4347817.1 ABC transporter permease [Lacisediminihabitans changchengi]